MKYYLISLISLILFICICCLKFNNEKKIKIKKKNKIKTAIAIMTMKPINFEVWLKYHLKYLKFDHIYIRIEDTPELKQIIDKYPNQITANFYSKQDNKNSYFSQMNRQDELINNAIEDCKKKNIKYLLHIDDDELFFLNKKYKSASQFFNTLNPNYDQAHFTNFEAIFPKEKDTCFSTNKFKNCKTNNCLSYANGKSAGRISNNLKPNGPHYFKGSIENIDPDQAMILHFDSCTYSKWYHKFNNLKNITDEKFNKIPFDFYKKSIKYLKKSIKKEDKEGYKFWKKNKVDPYYDNNSYTNIELNIDKIL